MDCRKMVWRIFQGFCWNLLEVGRTGAYKTQMVVLANLFHAAANDVKTLC